MAHIFISYSRKDLSFVEQLAADLKNAGHEVWYDVSGLRGGTRWRFEIEKAIQNSEAAIFVLSPNSIASEWVEREFLYSSNLKRKLVPLMYQPCELPLSYLTLNYIDVHGDNYKRNFGEILEALESESAGSFVQELRTPSSRPVSQEINKLNPVFLLGALVLIGAVIGAGLLMRRFYLTPSQNIIETSPTSPTTINTSMATETIASTPTPTATSNSAVISTTITPPGARLGDFWVSYDSNLNGNRDIFLLNPANGETTAIISDPSHDKVGSWSPDGKLLAFESNRAGGAYQIYLFNSDQGSIRPLTEPADCNNWAPTWSPDGEKIVFYSNCEDNQRNIYMMNRDGSGRKQLTSAAGENRYPVFSPDGKTITFTSSRNGRDQIWLMNADGSNQRPMADGCSSTFSPDGKWLWFSTRCEDSDIKRIQIDGTNLSTVGSIFGQNPYVSPDGGFVVFQSDDNIWVMDIEGSQPVQLTSGDALDSAPSWRP